MAQLDVEPKKNNDWWKWLLGILAAVAIIWLILEMTGDDDDVIENEPDPVAFVEYNSLSAPRVLQS